MTKTSRYAPNGVWRLVSTLHEKYVEENVEKDTRCPPDML